MHFGGLNLSMSLKSNSLATSVTLQVHLSGALWYQNTSLVLQSLCKKAHLKFTEIRK